MAYTNNDILKLINFTIRKDSKGQPLSRENFSILLDVHGLEYFEILYDRYEQTNEMSDSLRRFKETLSGGELDFTDTTIDLPSNYAHSGYLYHKQGGTDVKPVYIVSDDQFMMMQDSVIDEPTVDYPIARLTTDYIEYLPTTLNQDYFTFSYLRYPDSPYYDYYINTDGVVVYLDEGDTHVWVDDETDSAGTIHNTGDTNWTSLTSELDFNEEDKLKIAYRILQAMSVPIDEAGVFQYAQQLKMES